ncbi:MAG TPA: M23 family metallopeptidase, partial [Acidimicrobiales bacterium]|nr:M23 family metallopeptidase [Acidimicrobiales bacterium]
PPAPQAPLPPPPTPPAVPQQQQPAPPAPTTTSTAPRASVSPAAAQAYVSRLVRSGANSTSTLIAALKTLETIGLPADEVVRTGFGHFPVGGLATFTDDFGDPRFTPTFHTHQGTDIFAAFDTPVRAPFNGVVRFADEAVGGKSAYVTTADGTFYYMTHLKSFAQGVASGSRVSQGQIVGTVGDSGNAKGGAPHVHFEIHPRGGAAINPKPFLDQWLAEALAAVPKLVGGLVQDQPPVLQSTGVTRRFEMRDLDRRARPPVDPLLWASSVSPTASALRLAEVQAARVAESIDWEERAARAQAEEAEWRTAQEAARAALGPLTPSPLGRLVGPHAHSS